MDSGLQIASNNSERNEHAGFVIPKMSISITKTRNVCSVSFPNKGKSFRAVLPAHVHTTSVSL
jgi:hypothetical protein